MSDGVLRFSELDLGACEVLLCDADGNLFPSEGPAFDASTSVTNRLLAELGVARTFTSGELRRRAMGRNFRLVARELAAEAGLTVEHEALERWVEEERRAVTDHLGAVLRPDRSVSDPLRAMACCVRLALVSSSATSRLGTCLAATDLDELFAPAARFSAEDSLAEATSKPDPAIYAFAGRQLGVAGSAGLAVEDAVAGVQSAVAAGFPVIGNVQFVAPNEVRARTADLRDAGAAAIIPTWSHLAHLLRSTATGRNASRTPAG